MRKKKLVPSIDQKCICGHSYAAHYHLGVHDGQSVPACAQIGCCDRFRPESEATVRLATKPSEE